MDRNICRGFFVCKICELKIINYNQGCEQFNSVDIDLYLK